MECEVKKPEMLPHEYVRSGLKIGLQQEERLGVNPFKFGLVGATDAHTSLATTREENYFGKISMMEPGLDRWASQIVPDPEEVGTGTYEFETLASGLQGVWSRENTRESLWDAMKRKETYATTGTRMTVRVLLAGTMMRMTYCDLTLRRQATWVVCPWEATSQPRRTAKPPE